MAYQVWHGMVDVEWYVRHGMVCQVWCGLVGVSWYVRHGMVCQVWYGMVGLVWCARYGRHVVMVGGQWWDYHLQPFHWIVRPGSNGNFGTGCGLPSSSLHSIRCYCKAWLCREVLQNVCSVCVHMAPSVVMWSKRRSCTVIKCLQECVKLEQSREGGEVRQEVVRARTACWGESWTWSGIIIISIRDYHHHRCGHDPGLWGS